MWGFLRRLLRLRLDPRKELQNQFRILPKCTRYVLVMSPEYGDKNYTCEIVADASKLARWAARHAESVLGSDDREQMARSFMPVWLGQADVHNNSVSQLLPSFVTVLRPYISDFLSDGTARIICRSCGQQVTKIRKRKSNERNSVSWFFWTDEWLCQKGHLLYQESHEMHVQRTGRR